jgi:hypothetical protein
MKKLIIIAGLAISTLLSSCSIFVRTKHHAAGAAVGSTQPIHHDTSSKAAKG